MQPVPVRVTLPDGQTITANVLYRRREPGGSWWYTLELPLTARDEDAAGRSVPSERRVTFAAPYPQVQPIPGTDYRDVPDHSPCDEWRLEHSRYGRLLVLHDGLCWSPDPANTERIAPQAASDLLMKGKATACHLCNPYP